MPADDATDERCSNRSFELLSIASPNELHNSSSGIYTTGDHFEKFEAIEWR